MNAAAKTFLTAVATVAGAATMALVLADQMAAPVHAGRSVPPAVRQAASAGQAGFVGPVRAKAARPAATSCCVAAAPRA